MRIHVIAPLMLILLAACTRQPAKPQSTALDTFSAWSLGQFGFITNGPQCEMTTVPPATVELDVYGLTSTNLQESLLRALSATSPVPSKVTFWTSRPSFSLFALLDNGVPKLTKEQIEEEKRNKLIRTVLMEH